MVKLSNDFRVTKFDLNCFQPMLFTSNYWCVLDKLYCGVNFLYGIGCHPISIYAIRPTTPRSFPTPRVSVVILFNPIQYIPRNMHTVFALLCFVVVIHWLIFPYPSGLLHWHYGNLTIAPVPAKQPWWIWINTSCEFILNDSITTTKQSTTKPCAYFLGYTVHPGSGLFRAN